MKNHTHTRMIVTNNTFILLNVLAVKSVDSDSTTRTTAMTHPNTNIIRPYHVDVILFLYSFALFKVDTTCSGPGFAMTDALDATYVSMSASVAGYDFIILLLT